LLKNLYENGGINGSVLFQIGGIRVSNLKSHNLISQNIVPLHP